MKKKKIMWIFLIVVSLFYIGWIVSLMEWFVGDPKAHAYYVRL